MACGQQEAAKSNSTVKQGSMKEKINEDVKKKNRPSNNGKQVLQPEPWAHSYPHSTDDSLVILHIHRKLEKTNHFQFAIFIAIPGKYVTISLLGK